jgi:hypothetical protein
MIEPGTAKGFTEREYSILMKILQIHNDYAGLDVMHPSDRSDWADAVHRLQDIIALRATRRDYPTIFITYKS